MMRRKLVSKVIYSILVLGFIIICLSLYECYKYKKYSITVDDINAFFSRMENETEYRVITFKTASPDFSGMPIIYKIYVYGTLLFSKYYYSPIKNINSYSFSIINNKKNEFTVITHSFNNRIYKIKILYSDCFLEEEITSWINYLLSDFPFLESNLNVKCI